MIIYNHAYDIYNCAFRILSLLYKSNLEFTVEQIRIFDFMIAFPEMLNIATLPKGTKKGKKVKINQYMSPNNHKKIFYVTENFQISALNHLASAAIINKEKYFSGKVSLEKNIQLSEDLINQIELIGSSAINVINICINNLYSLPVDGEGGLKHRSKVMEYRYDTRI